MQYFGCWLNIIISITTFRMRYFWVYFTVSLVLLLGNMQLICVQCNALYVRLEIGVRRNPIGMAIFYISNALLGAMAIVFNLDFYTDLINVSTYMEPFRLFWNFSLSLFLCS